MTSRISDMVVTEYLRCHPMSILVRNSKTERMHLFRGLYSGAEQPRCECGSAVFTQHMTTITPPNDLYAVRFRWCYSCLSNGMQSLEEALEEAS